MYDMPATVVLNPHQRRHLEVLFAHLEDSLVDVERLMKLDPTRTQSLSLYDDDVDAGFREQAFRILGGLREQIAQLATSLALQPRRRSRRRAIAATLSAEAIRIEDSLSPQLRGYGEVHASVTHQLDPVLEDMARTLNNLAIASRRPARARTDE